jgi:hypothetical protein
MAIKNTELGGTDWVINEVVTPTDLNDTMNAAVNKVLTTTAFWLNNELYDVYDDFESYSTGAFTTNTNWTITITTTAGSPTLSSVIESSNQWLEGTSKLLVLTASASTASGFGSVVATSNGLGTNKHFFAKIRFTADSQFSGTTCGLFIQIGNISEVTIINSGALKRDNYLYLIGIAKGDGYYDVYLGSQKIISNLQTTVAPNIKIRTVISSDASTSGSVTFRIDDVRVSKGTVN